MKTRASIFRALGFLAGAAILTSARPLVAQDKIEGDWAALLKADHVVFKMSVFSGQAGDEREWNSSVSLKKAHLTGLQTGLEHDFEVRREAGKILFHGIFSGKAGHGDFEFIPNADFAAFLKNEGLDGYSSQKGLALCLHDVSRKYVQDIKKSGLDDLSLSKLIAFAVHRIDLDFINRLRGFGYPDISSSTVIAFKVHEIDGPYIQEMKKPFPDLSASHLIAFKVHGIDRGFVDGLARLFPDRISSSQVIAFAVHGISPAFVREIQSLGFEAISPSHMIAFKVHEIDGAYIKRVRGLMKGKDLSASKLISLKVAGI